MPRIISEPRYFSIPSIDAGAEVRMKRALNCCPWVRSLTHSPDAVTLGAILYSQRQRAPRAHATLVPCHSGTGFSLHRLALCLWSQRPVAIAKAAALPPQAQSDEVAA